MDIINRPKHYTQGKLETIDIIADSLSGDEYKGYLRGNILKYIVRYKFKGGVNDLKKSSWYLNKLIQKEEENGYRKGTEKTHPYCGKNGKENVWHRLWGTIMGGFSQ